MIKICTKCLLQKDETEFNWKDASKGKRHTQCNMCTRANVRKHYNNNKEYYIKKSHVSDVQAKELYKLLKSKPCTDCKIQYPWYVMQFDHIEDNKITNLARLSSSLNKMLLEWAKCELVCANCHAERTFKRKHLTSVA